MTPEDLRRAAVGTNFLRLDRGVGVRLVPALYAVGLFCILLWAVSHLFFSFASNWSNGLWGILEILGYGLFAVLALRILAEALLVFLSPASADAVQEAAAADSLLDEVRDAIRDLAEAEPEDEPVVEEQDFAPSHAAPEPPAPPAKPIRRTSKRAIKTPRTPI